MNMENPKRILLLTGNPGIGKTTVILKTAEVLRSDGYRVGGMLSREVRSDGGRIGFEILDIDRGTKGCLANVDAPTGPRIGKYRVNIKSLNEVGVEAISKAIETCDVIIIDEVGPMELSSQEFKKAVIKTTKSTRVIIATIHQRANDALITHLRNSDESRLFEITEKNREGLEKSIGKQARAFITSNQKKPL